jgi:hypothetical protein
VPTQAEYDRRQTLLSRELASRQVARLTRFQTRNDLSAAAKALAAEERATLLQKIAELDATLAGRRRPFAAAVLDPGASERLRQAHAELQSVRSELAADRQRSNAAAQHRAQGIAETARIREMAELNQVPLSARRSPTPSSPRSCSLAGATGRCSG